jgi:hypothetical protein
MNMLQTFAILLLGAGLGALLTRIQQTGVRRRFQQEILTQIDQALFDGSCRQRLLNLRRMSSTSSTSSSVPPGIISTADAPRIQLAVEWVVSPSERKNEHQELVAN